MPAYYRATLADFQRERDDTILGALARGIESDAFYELKNSAIRSWETELVVLRDTTAAVLSRHTNAKNWSILLEYPIPRRGKRADVIFIADDVLIVGEFKVGDTRFRPESQRQTVGYCLDLQDFHEQSRNLQIVPLLIVTDAEGAKLTAHPTAQLGGVQGLCTTNAEHFGQRLLQIWEMHHHQGRQPIDPDAWDNSRYFPTPTIIEAAQTLYAKQDVREVAHSHAGKENLEQTTGAVIEALHYAQEHHRKVICFITGVPGSGKTLAGLNIVHNPKLHKEDGTLGCFLSGNGPLVKVLQEALARDHSIQEGITKRQALHKVSSFIQNIHLFIKTHFDDPSKNPPPDRAIIFDEAQRAWDAAQNKRKWKRDTSEPSIVLEIMDRHPEWALVVALIGGGQEIHNGEAGLPEWGRVLREEKAHWEVWISPELAEGKRHGGNQPLFEVVPSRLKIKRDNRLHLSVSVRAYKAEQLSGWVEALLDRHSQVACKIASTLQDYRIYLTRDLEQARRWLRSQTKGDRRCGLVVSSGARRLRPHGIDPTIELPVEQWFLNAPDDVRSSSFLELAATEFAVQGLELDWAGVCWGADLRWGESNWIYRQFKGTEWEAVNSERKQQYILNKYRVLLTRAREGMIIWVPEGDDSDRTRERAFYDGTADYLIQCGVQKLEEGAEV